MRLSRSVINNLCALSLIGSVVEQMETRRDQYSQEMQNLHDELRSAHKYARDSILEEAEIPLTADGLFDLPKKELGRWTKIETAFFDTVLKCVPEKTLDARMWVTAVMVVVEDFISSIPVQSVLYRDAWNSISDCLASIYALYDPGFRCKAKMREGMDKGIKILEVLK